MEFIKSKCPSSINFAMAEPCTDSECHSDP